MEITIFHLETPKLSNHESWTFEMLCSFTVLCAFLCTAKGIHTYTHKVTKSCLTLQTLWTIAFRLQGPLSSDSQGKYWNGLPCPLPGNLLIPGIKPMFLISFINGSYPLVPPGKLIHIFWERMALGKTEDEMVG